ncbi:hypothetical protein D3C76_1145470 [compost metagenome]
MTNRHTQADGPGQDADEVGVHQRTDRIVDHAQQQALQHFSDAARSAQGNVRGAQGQVRREGHARYDRDHRRSESTEEVQHQDRPDMGFGPVFMVGDRGHDQNEHQDRRHGLEGRDEHLADEAQAQGNLGGDQGQGNTGHQTDHDLQDQTGTVQ